MQPPPDPKHLLYRDGDEFAGDRAGKLAAYYVRSGDGPSRTISRSVWEAIQMIPPGAERVLDIGCHVGYLGQIAKASRSIEVIGIELDEAAARAARQHLDQVVVQDIERSADLPFPPGYFDCVTMLDVIEHLILPDRVMAKVRRYLKPEGCIICSVPNVRHISVLGSLLVPGQRWTIEGQGMITDPPHLRFFTFDDLIKLLNDTGYRMDSPICGTCSDPNFPFLLELVEHLRGISVIPEAHLARLRIEMNIFQFVFRARAARHAPPPAAMDIRLVPNSLHRLDELMQGARQRSRPPNGGTGHA